MRFQSPISLFTGIIAIVVGLGACESSSGKLSLTHQKSPNSEGVSSQSPTSDAVPQNGEQMQPSPLPDGPVAITYSPINERIGIESEVEPTDILQREAIKISEGTETEWKGQGVELMKSKSFEEAILAFRKALWVSPQDPDVFSQLGQAYIKTGNLQRGVECLGEATSLEPSNANIQAALVRGQLQQDDTDLVIDSANTLCTLEPNAFRSHFLMGRAYSVGRMWQEAIESYQAALKIKPDHTYANNNLGFVALQVRQNDLAVQSLEKATDQDNATAFMFNNLGLAYERIQEPVSAMTAYSKSLEVSPKYVKAIINKDRVSETLTLTQQEEFAAWLKGDLLDDEIPLEPEVTVASVNTLELEAPSNQEFPTEESSVETLGGSVPTEATP